MEKKKCEICGQMLPQEDFSKSYKNRCRVCVAEMARDRRYAARKSEMQPDKNKPAYESREFECDPTIMAEFAKKLAEATKYHRIFWHKDSSNRFYARKQWNNEDLKRFFISFHIEGEMDAIRLYLDDLYKTYTPEDAEVWEHLKALEWQIQENQHSIEATLYSMMRELLLI